MAHDADASLAAQQREALISLTAVHYIEEHELLERAQLSDARKSLQALYLRTSGAETMLRRLIEALKARRNLHSRFSRISSTFVAIRRSIEAMEERAGNLRRHIERSPVSAEAHAQFVGPFLSFSIQFLQKIGAFERVLQKYLVAREQQARMEAAFRIAEESREHLRRRLTTSTLGQASGSAEARIKNEVTTSLNYDDAAAAMQAAVRQARVVETEVQASLDAIAAMCEAATDPARREGSIAVKPEDDVFLRFTELLAHDTGAKHIEEPVSQLLLLYERAHTMFRLDFDRLKRGLQQFGQDTGAYFSAKAEDRDISTKREKLRKVEALIQFLERAAQLTAATELNTYAKFSKAFSEAITEKLAAWTFAAENLLSAKVRAEAELNALR